MSRSSPSAWKSFFPAFFISFHEESGSMAINPSARERQRRSATRRSWTASASKPRAARSHSASTRSIQARSPSFGLGVAGFGFGPVPTDAPFADGNHCRLFARILLARGSFQSSASSIQPSTKAFGVRRDAKLIIRGARKRGLNAGARGLYEGESSPPHHGLGP